MFAPDILSNSSDGYDELFLEHGPIGMEVSQPADEHVKLWHFDLNIYIQNSPHVAAVTSWKALTDRFFHERCIQLLSDATLMSLTCRGGCDIKIR